MWRFCFLLFCLTGWVGTARAGVNVSTPSYGANVQSPVHFAATASTTCAKGVSAVGIYAAPGVLAYKVSGSSLNANLNLSPGTYNAVVQAWDNCGGSTKADVKINVVSGSQVQVTKPLNNSTVGSPVHFLASATTSCSQGVAAMGVYTSPGVLVYSQNGATLDTWLNLSAGTYNTVVQSWDHCGGSSKTPITVTATGSNQAGVTVTAPTQNAVVGSPVQYVASATTGCARGVAAMGIYTAPGKLAFVSPGAKLNTSISLGNGTYDTTVQEWDNCGGTAKTPVTIKVGSGSTGGGGGGVFTDLQQTSGWTGYGLLAPAYQICPTCTPSGPQVTWYTQQWVKSPSLSGGAMQFDIGGKTPYSDVLWNRHLIGHFGDIPDTNQTLAPSLHNFVYDVWFFAKNIEVSQALEFDINQFVKGKSFIWGHECRIMGGHEWDTWDNVAERWVPSGIPCNPVNNAWNHLVIQVQRTSDDHLLFQSITLNGKTAVLNRYDSPTPTSWYGVTINYQIDGNYAQQFYSVWLDKLNFKYW